MDNDILDSTSEKILNELILKYKDKYQFHLEGVYPPKRIIDNFINKGYLEAKFYPQETDLPQEFYACDAKLTQKALAYNKNKNRFNANKSVTNNIYNFISGNGNKIDNSINISTNDESQVYEAINEFENLINLETLTKKQKRELLKQTKKIKKLKNKNKPSLFKKALLELFNLVKELGIPVLIEYLKIKFNLE